MRHAWILAGGRSSRFGSDKAEFVIAGETLLVRTARVCAEAGLPPHAVARHPRPGGVPTRLEAADAPRHPLTGVAEALAGAAELGHADAVVLPVDLAELAPAVLAALAASAAPAYARDQPLLAVLPVRLRGAAADAAARGAPVRAFLDAIGATPLDLGPIANLNRAPGAG